MNVTWTVRSPHRTLIDTPDGFTIMITRSGAGVPTAEWDDLARLIVATPEMHAFVQDVATWLISPSLSPDTIEAVRVEARAILSRIKDRQP